MVTVRLAGGLGNQIFQFAAALLYANGEQDIVLDTSGMSRYESKHTNELMKFFDLSHYNMSIREANSYIAKMRLAKLFAFKIVDWPLIGDKNFEFSEEFEYHQNIFMDGYFQEGLTQQAFDKEVELLKPLLIRKNFAVESADVCIIHIRGGDFVRLGWNTVTPKEYYQAAITHMQTGNVKFHIVTDDREYAKNVFDDMGIEYKFVGSSIIEDFFLIGAYSKRILSSSTFSFWASALGNNVGSAVVAPSYWIPERKRKIFLPNEIRLEMF